MSFWPWSRSMLRKSCCCFTASHFVWSLSFVCFDVDCSRLLYTWSIAVRVLLLLRTELNWLTTTKTFGCGSCWITRVWDGNRWSASNKRMNEPTFDEDEWLMDGGWFSKTRKAPTKKKKKNRGNRIEKRNAWAITIAYFLLPISCYCTSRDKRRVGRWFTTGLVVMMNHHMCVNVLGCSASTQLSSSRGFHSAFPRRPFFLGSRLFSFISSIFLLFFFPKLQHFQELID